MNRPNLLYFVCHDLGQHIGCYGVPVATPRLDAFAAQSIRFQNAFCSSPACSPSRNCAMTGLYAHVSGGIGLAHMGWPLPEDVRTVVDDLNEAGYETIHAGMEHDRHPQQNHYHTELQTGWSDFNVELAVDKALACLARRSRNRPFYLNIGSQQPHPSTWHRIDLHGAPVPSDEVYIPPYLADRPHVRNHLGAFQAAIQFMDAQFGRLLDGLARLDHGNDTIVIFTTDHGIAAPRSKGTLYDRGCEIALLVRAPDRPGAGTTTDALIPNIDLRPTLLEAAGLPIPSGLNGRSFWPLIAGEPYQPHSALFTERNFHGEHRLHSRSGDFVDRYDPIRAVRTRDFHYIRTLDPTIKGAPWLPFDLPVTSHEHDSELGYPPPRNLRPEEELFHVRFDPQEFVNLAGRPEFRAVQETLRRQLDAWMTETHDFALRGDVPSRHEKPGWGNWNPIDTPAS